MSLTGLVEKLQLDLRDEVNAFHTTLAHVESSLYPSLALYCSGICCRDHNKPAKAFFILLLRICHIVVVEY